MFPYIATSNWHIKYYLSFQMILNDGLLPYAELKVPNSIPHLIFNKE